VTGTAQRVGQAIALVVVAALLGLLVWKVAFDREGGAAAELADGRAVAAPAFTLDRLDRDGQLSMASLRGKAVVVNFWASWCVPCRDEAPVLQETYERYRDRGLVVLGVDVNDFRQDARKFLRRFGVTYPVVYDGKGSTVGRWGVRAFPETFFVDRSGKLVGQRIAGAVDIARNRDAYERGVALALGDTP
jgi:cytochrome c biogenesis protein CcmG, thiol:disulfide interchange protein DsbE